MCPKRESPVSARLVCRERSTLRGDGGSVTSRPPPWLEARARLGCQTAGELGAPAISSIPEQLPGHEPASARKGYEGERALQCRDRCFDRSFGRSNPTRWASFLRYQHAAGWAELLARLPRGAIAAIGLEPSGGYERNVVRILLAAGFSVGPVT